MVRAPFSFGVKTDIDMSNNPDKNMQGHRPFQRQVKLGRCLGWTNSIPRQDPKEDDQKEVDRCIRACREFLSPDIRHFPTDPTEEEPAVAPTEEPGAGL